MTSIPGSEIVRQLGTHTGEDRERAILALAETGAFPLSLANFVRIEVTREDAAGKAHTFAYDVTHDYFSLGTDEDYIRMPMWPITAQRILDSWHCILPTPRMVEQIHKQAAKIVMPTAEPPRTATSTYASTNAKINERVAKLGLKLGALVSGHRKDVVVCKGLKDHPTNVVIYAGMQADGTWWQMKSNATSHDNRYVDYSHGFRFVRWEMLVDDVARDIRDVLRDATLAPLLSADGPLSMLAYPLLPQEVR